MKRPTLTLLLLVGFVVRSLAAGAPTAPKAHWAFQPVQSPPPPLVQKTDWCQTSVDRFILSRLESEQVTPAPPADRRALIRRATFDLTGLPPSASEIDAFVADTSPNAWMTVVNRLLDSPHYGEHWGRHWLDVVRYADTAGETADYPVPVAWRYRNYVIDAFNSDKPYDEFLREQIAGDILARQGPRERYAERVTATGYLAISRRFGFDSENYHHLTIQDTIDTVGQSVLGLTLGCARCHAHKYDPVSMPEYYGLYGIFDSTRYAFPGSEQKQRHRAMVPLVGPEESTPKWQAFEMRVASLTKKLERQKQSVPAATLRSLDELDGDFEMQAPAAGGSKGVLVPPWVYDGPIAVTQDAQSPFKNLHPLGKVGASVASSTNTYRIGQSLHPRRTRESSRTLQVNLDFRLGTHEPAAQGIHRFWIGGRRSGPAVEVLLASASASVRTGDRVEVIRSLGSNAWHNLQLTLDLQAGTVSGSIGSPGDVSTFPSRPLSAAWSGSVDFVGIDGQLAGTATLPSIALDNLGVQESPIAPVTTHPPAFEPSADELDLAAVDAQLKSLVGLDGDLELQTDGAAPAAPWNPGPKSDVKIRSESQSPFHNVYPPGRLGIHLPNSGAYNGFGLTLTQRWEAGKTPQLVAGFDFRPAHAEAAGDGSWRFYLGRGPGSSAAVELFINRDTFFKRSGDTREAVQPLKLGTWYQIQLALDLKEKRYTGTIRSDATTTEFSGQFATGWDGTIDYAFIDSYGHLGGVKPALDTDNIVLRDTPFPTNAVGEIAQAPESSTDSRRVQVAALRKRLADAATAAAKTKQELETLLAEGPFDMVYGVTEGTPQNARIQIRGEPDRPGDEVPRGFLGALNGGPLADDTEGSGRLELAQWLTQPTHPLTARVMVNRLWQYHFGQGLVKTPNDFGARGQPPTHPELLDHLATEFVRKGWSIKAMHRLILASATYQQRSRYSANTTFSLGAPATVECPVEPSGLTASKKGAALIPVAAKSPHPAMDAAPSEVVSPFTRRRLGAEEVRDAILKVSGELDPTPGQGHPFPAPTSWGYTQHGPYNATYDHNRRSVYLMTQRIKRHPFLALFDGADPNASSPERRTSTVPTQALFFLNDPFVHANADAFARRVLTTRCDESQQIATAYRLALGRNPTPSEQHDAATFLTEYRTELEATGKDDPQRGAHAAFARVLFGSNEFLTVD